MSDTFDLLHYAAFAEAPERLTSIESWHRHIPFAFALLAMVRPRVLVELGTHRGDSYSAFCQGVSHQALETRCFAVDTWQGDSQAGLYEDDIYAELSRYHDPRYSSFSSLMRMTFDDAQLHFEDGSVDLLHIDGLHTYDAVRHDFESWLPKLSDRAVVLFHDTNVRRGDFAVWKLWGELTQRYSGFEFPYGFGLGVLVVGANPPPALLQFIALAQADPNRVVQLFHGLGDAAAYFKAQRELETTRERLEAVGSQLGDARTVVEARDQHLQQVLAQVESLGAQLIEARAVVEQRDEHLQQMSSVHFLAQRSHEREREQLMSRVALLDLRLAQVLGSRVWRLRNRLLRLVGRPEPLLVAGLPVHVPRPWPPAQVPVVDVIIPVYRGLEETRRCIESVLASAYLAQSEVIVINDASPDPQLVDWLATLDGRVTLLHNEQNLGFVGTVNRGMCLHPERDVVLVNSDTEVANDWLDRLQQAAYGAAEVGSVTPFSNNATLCSYPQLCQDNPLPAGLDTAELDRLFKQVNAGQVVDIPTGVGFCMFIRRDCLEENGLFNAELFGRGYGEENEFCMRSAARGWRHLLCADTFVYHAGGVSFANTQGEHQQIGRRALNRLYPDYDRLIQQHLVQDPSAHLRFAVDMALAKASGKPVILMINHRRGGGTERHLRDLGRELADNAEIYVLRPLDEGGKASLGPLNGGQRAHLVFDPITDFELLLGTLRELGVTRLHFHHTIGVHLQFLLLPEKLSLPYDVTVHDYYLACPQVTLADRQGRYCGAPDEAGCNSCLASRPAPGGADIQHWRSFGAILLNGAERVFVPCQDTLARMRRYFPDAPLHCAVHEQSLRVIPVEPLALVAERPLKIAVLGALSLFKGADALEGCALEARRRRLPLEFHLLGFAYRHLRSHPVSTLHTHGAYQEDELAHLLKALQPDLVWFPGSCPETYSYTLSACLIDGLPVVAPAIGAFSERLAGRSWSWLVQPDRSVDEILDHLLDVRRQLLAGEAPQVVSAPATPIGFSYREDYLAELPREPAQTLPPTDWAALLLRWSRLGTIAPAADDPLSRYPRGLRALRQALGSRWIRPLFLRVPTAWRIKAKQLLLRKA
ncbi:MAG: class I SAM-dependent methyltransferase [Pseudomonas sp.]|uniref:class I SAM-dependent methyltransferase n=1 Tax=Pseudomonas sp. TaxID=306 RepID=UPI003399B928